MDCPRCKTLLLKRGKRKTNLKTKQLYYCNKCQKKITLDWPRMRFSQRTVMRAVRMHRNGMSLGDIQKELDATGIKVSRWGILKWVRKFSS